MRKMISLITFVLVSSCSSMQKNSNIKIISVKDVNWEKLNPARGDKSPQAGTLWGDRKGDKVPTGFLAKFVDGFSSPPHIHNVSYRAIVISGLIHNDDPKAANMWMPSGSYWTQPAGESHITSAKGITNMALVEIDSAPYLVRPIQEEFDNGERPYNIHSNNIIWRDFGENQIVDLWKNKAGIVTGSLLKFNKELNLRTKKSKFVIIQGKVKIREEILLPGSLIEASTEVTLDGKCLSEESCLVYQKNNLN